MLMKTKNMVVKISTALCIGLAAGLLAGCASDKEDSADKAKLMAEAKISQADAQKTALEKVPNGTVKEGELEKEHGKLQWSFDVATPGTTDITEVNVDAITGMVINTEKESAESEADEDAGKKDKD
jgi:uncharacterized membrane protein YkoI